MNTYQKSGSSLITNGILSFIAGITLLFLTGISQAAVVFLFAAYAIIYGISQLVAAKGERSPNNSPNSLRAIGIFSIIAGLLLLLFPAASLAVIILFIAFHAFVTGIAESAAAIVYREEIKGYGWFLTAGIIRILFGIFLLFSPGITLSALVLAIAWYAIIIGPVLVIYGYEITTKTSSYGRQKPAH